MREFKEKYGKKYLIYPSSFLSLPLIYWIEKLYRILKENKKLDESQSPTSFLFHLFFASELKRRETRFTSLVLRFSGDRKKLEEEIKIQGGIARLLGGYRLSLPSGSEKFSVYPLFSPYLGKNFHIKTSGTSWLKALEIVAEKNPPFFRKLHWLALESFEKEKKSYEVKTDLSRIPSLDSLPEEKLSSLFNLPAERVILHLSYGSFLRKFKKQIYSTLFRWEKDYYERVSSRPGHKLDFLGLKKRRRVN